MEDIIPHDYWNQKNEEDIQNLETLNSTVTALHLPNPHFLKRILISIFLRNNGEKNCYGCL